MDYEMETDYQQDYIAQSEPNQEEYQQIQYLYSMLYQVRIFMSTLMTWKFIINWKTQPTIIFQMMPRFEDQESMDDEEMELVLNAIEYIKGLYLKHFQQSWADTAMTSDTYSNTIVLRSP